MFKATTALLSYPNSPIVGFVNAIIAYGWGASFSYHEASNIVSQDLVLLN
jgi:hypothetical protein